MPTPFDHALAVVLALLFPIRSRLVLHGKLARANPDELPAARLGAYRGAMVTQWFLTAALAALWLATGRPWRELGVVPVLSGGLIGILVGVAIVAVVLARAGRAGPDGKAAASLRRQTAKLERMMPRSRADLRAFYALSVTAGICEELLYRGFMIHYLLGLGLPLIPAAVASSLVFGFGHLYQGLRGMVTTAAVGGFLAAVYLLSGSLLPGMLIHALMDLYSGRLLYLAYSRPEAPAAEVSA